MSTEAHGTVVDRLRDLADELASNTGGDGAQLVPIRADEVKPGDVASQSVGERLVVAAIEVIIPGKASGSPLLRIRGHMTTAHSADGFAHTYVVYADNWVVVER